MLQQRLFVNATVHTLWADKPVAATILTRGERIVAVGTTDELRSYLTGAEEVVDLEGNVVVPGLTDSHIHLANYAREISAVNLRGVKSLQEALQTIREYCKDLPKDAWVLGGRWDFNAWAVPKLPTRQELDSVTDGRPAALASVDGHTTWVNTQALRIAGISANDHDPVGGEIVRDDAGEPTGILRETARDRIKHLMDAGAGNLKQQMETAQKRLLAVGLTGAHDFDGEDCLDALSELHQDGILSMRVHKGISMAGLDAAIGEGRATGNGDLWLNTGPVKLFSDGALGSHTCHMSQAFAGDDSNFGMEVLPYDTMLHLVRKAAAAGIAVATHAIGDQANHLVLDAYEDLLNNPQSIPSDGGPLRSPLRHRIEHTQHLQPADVQRIIELGVVPSMQPTHCTTDIPLASTMLVGRDLASYAWNSLIKAGGRPAFGSDAPVELPNPMHGIHAAVTRQNAMSQPDGGWQPDERISVSQALHGFTTGAAYASAEEHLKGMIRPGMLADFTVLAQDPFQVAPVDLRDIPVHSTIVGGQVRFWSTN
ncbi:amidohydrolase [Paeniglutamicibacter psychrophenolicus]|uniref:Amidohydrolase YtcJ n=1 Tax=Paeniglutamicibacter psychrophenolicus TaxID=257454 RepID=A0ABS4WAF3_9MICC|nr:amidohydrolase [Paeniglutamicibacter psychrophenolicus]MBP2373185.1 putative amidohydrolase YtcJ [Paeniglutamicibacter psychrophenolicus]